MNNNPAAPGGDQGAIRPPPPCGNQQCALLRAANIGLQAQIGQLQAQITTLTQRTVQQAARITQLTRPVPKHHEIVRWGEQQWPPV